MSCVLNCVRRFFVIFNGILFLCSLALVICAVLMYMIVHDVPENLQSQALIFSIGIIIMGCIVFVIAFLGRYGVIKECDCMLITYAISLLTLLVIQVCIAIAIFVVIKAFNRKAFEEVYKNKFDNYWTSDFSRGIIDFTQINFQCCGIESSSDFFPPHPHMNGTIPRTCCELYDIQIVNLCPAYRIFKEGCSQIVFNFFHIAGKILGGIIGIELVSIISAVYLVNSIRNKIYLAIHKLLVRFSWKYREEQRLAEEHQQKIEESRRERRQKARDHELRDDQLCVVCTENPREIILLPCGHVCLCEDCADNIKQFCPICRGIIGQKATAYIV